MGSLLIVSFVEWAGAFQRPQHMAVALARRGWRVTYASPGYIHRRARGVAPGVDLPPTLRVVQPPALPGSSRSEWLARINQRWMLRTLRRLARREGTPWRRILFNDPRWADVVADLPAEGVVFDCMDDLAAMAPSADWAACCERRAVEVADRIVTGTASLADRLEGRHPHVRFIPCGVEAEHFASAPAEAVEAARRALPPGEGPVAGYFGAINERFDMERLEALMASAPWRVVLIGPTSSRAPRWPDGSTLDRPYTAPNGACACWIGPRPYHDLPAWLHTFDLALIPYDITGPHRFLYPVKALEYLAAACPVLATPLPDVVRFLGDYVTLADTPQQWTNAGRRLAADRSDAQARARTGRTYARSRSWKAMIDELEEELEAAG